MSTYKTDENGEVYEEVNMIQLMREKDNMTDEEVLEMQRNLDEAFAILFSDEDDEVIS